LLIENWKLFGCCCAAFLNFQPAISNFRETPVSLQRVLSVVVLLWLLCAGGCRQSAPNDNATAHANANAANVSAPLPPPSNAPLPGNAPAAPVAAKGQPVPARVPEQFRATLTVKLDKKVALTADVARNGTDRRFDFKLPDGTNLIYLYQTDRLFLILPEQKIYAVQEGPAGAFALPGTLDPERLTQQLQADARYEPAGEEKFNQRAAAKYRYTGGVESFVYVDKATGLPLHVELAQPKANPGEFVATAIELSGLNEDIPLKHFNEPRDMQEVSLAQVRAVFDRVLQTSGARP
jgi:hypothetical protein